MNLYIYLQPCTLIIYQYYTTRFTDQETLFSLISFNTQRRRRLIHSGARRDTVGLVLNSDLSAAPHAHGIVLQSHTHPSHLNLEGNPRRSGGDRTSAEGLPAGVNQASAYTLAVARSVILTSTEDPLRIQLITVSLLPYSSLGHTTYTFLPTLTTISLPYSTHHLLDVDQEVCADQLQGDQPKSSAILVQSYLMTL